MELREKIADAIREFCEESRAMAMPKLTESRRMKLADRVLALLESETDTAYDRGYRDGREYGDPGA